MSDMTQPGDLLKVAETATITGFKESTIRAWILQRRIPFVKLFGAVRIRRKDLEELIETSVVAARKSEEAMLSGGEGD